MRPLTKYILFSVILLLAALFATVYVWYTLQQTLRQEEDSKPAVQVDHTSGILFG